MNVAHYGCMKTNLLNFLVGQIYIVIDFYFIYVYIIDIHVDK